MTDAWCELVNTVSGMTKAELRAWLDKARQVAIRQEVTQLDDGKQNRKAAMQVLREFTLADTTKPLHPDLFDWLSGAFEQILSGENPEEALQLKRQPGEKDTDELAPDPTAIALYVELRHRKDGLSKTDAKQAAQDFFNRGASTIRDAMAAVDLTPFDESDYPRLWAYIHAQQEARKAKAERIKRRQLKK